MKSQKLGRVPQATSLVAELPFLEQEEEPRWSVRTRFLFIVTAASACWAVPATIAYLVFAH